jgi:hypothetical protein
MISCLGENEEISSLETYVYKVSRRTESELVSTEEEL